MVVRNGFVGDSPVEVIVEAETVEQALRLAAGALRRQLEDEREERYERLGGTHRTLSQPPDYYTPSERWTAQAVELPYVTGG